jgi:hypothetical protein
MISTSSERNPMSDDFDIFLQSAKGIAGIGTDGWLIIDNGAPLCVPAVDYSDAGKRRWERDHTDLEPIQVVTPSAPAPQPDGGLAELLKSMPGIRLERPK